jgi:hypothetical protein
MSEKRVLIGESTNTGMAQLKKYNALNHREPVQTHGGTNKVLTILYLRIREDK